MMLQAGDVRLTLDAEHGGRIASLSVGGTELLVAEADVDDPLLWGCYPMVPWAGRVRGGRFRFRDSAHELPLGAPPHAIHGVGFDRPWTVAAPDSLRLDLDDRWPFGGSAVQHFELHEDGLAATMTVTAGDQVMPVMAGWHPCFRPPVRLDVDAAELWERDAAGIPTGQLVPPPERPWDDAVHLRTDPRLVWPDGPEVTLRSSCPVWVVYDQDPRLVCVEPQTDAPDAFNREPLTVEPGEQLEITLHIDWTRR